MKFRTTLAALAAVATLTLAACGSDDDAAGESNAPAASSPVASAPVESDATGSEAAGSEAAGSEAAGSEAAGSEAAGSEAAGSEDAGSDDAGAGAGAGVGACQGVLDILQDLPGLLTKVTGEGVTQEDVDAVFTEERMSSVPEDLVESITTIKDQASGLVGKAPADAAQALTGLSSSVQELSGKVQAACTG